ncbi:hypothetical protein BDZ89DRAFT_1073864 [Hymenopellis radicata]|nr:hypothetical protein BDZ89DRAFT_1073864 [Hymenopellis radicata]
MPRPSPLQVSYSGTAYEEITLTPRTPHSRSGRAEEGYSSSGFSQYDDDEPQSSAEPLLGSSEEKQRAPNSVLASGPVVFWSVVASMLLCLAGISFQWPGTLEYYMGITPFASETTSAVNSSLLISYENYTTFPLTSEQYVAECYTMTKGFMPMDKYWEPHAGAGVMDVPHLNDRAVCSSTITYMLDGARGLFADLALIAQAAALARERGRTFLIDDTYWNRGKWTDHFKSVRITQPGPEPNCKPPPPEEYVACPRLARHWVITSRTAKFHFGHMFRETYEDAYKHNTERLKPIFEHAALSISKTIQPNDSIAHLISLARTELPSFYVAAHIRRGDRKPGAYEYRGSYVPLPDFADMLSDAKAPVAFLASDSPKALAELTEIMAKRPQEYFQATFASLDEETRVRATQGMVVDFALLTGLWAGDADIFVEKLVCTMSSVICRMAAAALGWEKAFGEMDGQGEINREEMVWVDIDEKGKVIPQWSGYDTF